jgi:hypothetical protein
MGVEVPIMAADVIPASAVKKTTNLVRDARLAVLVGLIPILGLIFILRLVQWYLLRQQFPILATADAGEHSKLARDFHRALSRLWFAVLFWPLLIVCVVVYSVIMSR